MFFSILTAPIRSAAASTEQAVNDYVSYSPTLNLLGLSGTRNRQTYQSNPNSLSNLANQAFTQLTGISYNNNVKPQTNNRVVYTPVQYVNPPNNQVVYTPVSNNNQVYTPVSNNNQANRPITNNQVQQSQRGKVVNAKIESNLSYPLTIDIKTVSTLGKCSVDYPTMDWARIVTNLGSSHTLDMQMAHRLEFNCADCGPTGVKITSFRGNC